MLTAQRFLIVQGALFVLLLMQKMSSSSDKANDLLSSVCSAVVSFFCHTEKTDFFHTKAFKNVLNLSFSRWMSLVSDLNRLLKTWQYKDRGYDQAVLAENLPLRPQTTRSLIFCLLVATKNATGPATPFIRSFSVRRSHESRQK